MEVSLQVSKSILGYFDADGIFFNTDGFDEWGGYYDDEGVYRDAEHDKEINEAIENDTKEHVEELTKYIEESKDEVFNAVVSGFLESVKEEDIKKELEKLSINFGKIALEIEEDKSQSATIEIKDKKSAKQILMLHSKPMLGEIIEVDFPEDEPEEAEPEEKKVEPEKEVISQDLKAEIESEGFELEIIKK